MKLEDEIVQKGFRDPFHKLAINLQFTAAHYRNEFRGQLKPYGVSPEQFNILRILRGQHPNPASAKLVADRMIDGSSNVSRLVEKLRVKGLVTRTACDQDRRAIELSITPDGYQFRARRIRVDRDFFGHPTQLPSQLFDEPAASFITTATGG